MKQHQYNEYKQYVNNYYDLLKYCEAVVDVINDHTSDFEIIAKVETNDEPDFDFRIRSNYVDIKLTHVKGYNIIQRLCEIDSAIIQLAPKHFAEDLIRGLMNDYIKAILRK